MNRDQRNTKGSFSIPRTPKINTSRRGQRLKGRKSKKNIKRPGGHAVFAKVILLQKARADVACGDSVDSAPPRTEA